MKRIVRFMVGIFSAPVIVLLIPFFMFLDWLSYNYQSWENSVTRDIISDWYGLFIPKK